MVSAKTSAIEASATPDECREMAKETKSRKYRLEGSAGGNSRLVGKTTALRLRMKYGGEIVNYRPAPLAPPLELDAAARELPPCPVCGVGEKMACREGRPLEGWPKDPRQRRRPHAARLKLQAAP